MPFTPHTLVQFGGRIINPILGAEIWSCGVRVGRRVGGAANQDYADYLAGPLLAWFRLPAHLMASIAFLDYVKVNEISAAGNYADTANTYGHNYTGVTSGGAGALAPQFCSVAYSWVTDSARGPGSKGRIYPPNFAGINGSDAGGIAPASQQQHLTAALDLLRVLNNSAVPSDGTAGVYSSIGGAHHPITGARIGNFADTQRKRKNAYNENYLAGAL